MGWSDLSKEEPGGVQNSLGMQYPRTFPQIVLRLLFCEVGEHGKGIDQRELRISNREGSGEGFFTAGIMEHVENIVMMKVEVGRDRVEIILTPADHPGMQVDPNIQTWAGTLQEKLTRDAPASAAEVKNLVIGLCRKPGID